MCNMKWKQILPAGAIVLDVKKIFKSKLQYPYVS